MTKPNTHCTCGKKMGFQETQGFQETSYDEVLHVNWTKNIGGKLPFCKNKSCTRYLLLQVSEVEQ